MLNLRDLSSTSCLYITPSRPPKGRKTILETVYLKAIRPAIETSGVNIYTAEKLANPAKVPGSLSSEVTSVDFVVAEISERDAEVFFYLGLAKALSKIIITLRHHGSAKYANITRNSDFHLDYDTTSSGLMDLHKDLKEILLILVQSTQIDDQVIAGYSSSEYPLSWKRVDALDYENFMHELLLREGYENVIRRSSGDYINAVALRLQDVRSKEISLFSIGNIPSDHIELRKWMNEYKGDILDLIRDYSKREDIYILDNATVVTIWFVWSPYRPTITDNDVLRELIRSIERADQSMKIAARYGPWNRQYVENILRRHPTLAQKYLEREGPQPDVGRQKDIEDLYKETVRIGQRAVDTTKKIIKKYEIEPGDFWQNIAFTATHSIGNTLFPIEINADLLIKRMSEDPDSETMEMLQEIKDYVEQAKVRIAKFKRIAGRSAPQIRPVDIFSHIKRAAQIAERSGISTNIYSHQDLPKVNADPDKLDEILGELVDNSRKWLHGLTNKSVSIMVQVADFNDLTDFLKTRADRFIDRFLWIRFSDNGPGVQSELKEKIFQLFYSKDPQGMGFGLGIVKKNMKDFGGDVAETGAPGAGVQFDLFFPVHVS